MAQTWVSLLFSTSEAGVSSAVAPELLPDNQNAWMFNGQNRGGKPSTRPPIVHCLDLPEGLIQGGESFSVQNGMIVASIAGRMFRIRVNANSFSWEEIPLGFINSPVVKQVWMTQTIETLVIQDGQSDPILYNGSVAPRAGPTQVPRGRMMAYGNGRLWVAVDANNLEAGDIRTGTPSSELYFTEATYLLGGGKLFFPQALRALSFIPVTGQSDYGVLLAYSDDETKAIRADITSRDDWGQVPGFVTDILRSVGASSQWSIASVNQDLYWRDSNTGIRSIRNALADEAGPGSSPVSREVSRLVDYDSQQLLAFCSSVYHDNRLLMTSSPYLMSNGGTGFKSLVSLDFATLSTMQGKSPPAFDGQWSGLNFVKLISGKFNGQNRAFTLVTDDQGNNQLWEFKNRGRADLTSDCGTGVQIESPIKCYLEYPLRNFGVNKVRKRLERCDVWLSQVDGPLDLQVYWLSDNSAKWLLWDEAPTCAQTTDPATEMPHVWKNLLPQERPQFKTFTIPEGVNEVVKYATSVGFEFQIRLVWTGRCRIHRMMLFGTILDDPNYADRSGYEVECVENSVDGNEITYSIPGCPTLYGPPCGGSYDFGLDAGIITVVYPIENLGLGDLIIGEITVDTEGWSVVQPVPSTIPPGETSSFSVSFDPTGLPAGSYPATLTIPSNDPDSPCIIALTAYAGAPAVIFEQYDGPFVFPPTFHNADSTEYYTDQSAGGGNGLKYQHIPNNPNRSPCLVDPANPGIDTSATGTIKTEWSGAVHYDINTGVFTGDIIVDATLAGILPGPGSNVVAPPNFTVTAQSIDSAFTDLFAGGGAFLAEVNMNSQVANDGYHQTWFSLSGDNPADGYFSAGFMGLIWCKGYVLDVVSSGLITVSDLGYVVARTGDPARTQDITSNDIPSRTFQGTKSRAVFTIPIATSQTYLSGNYIYLVTPTVGDPYYVYESDEHTVTPAMDFDLPVEYPMIVDATVYLESYSFSRFKGVEDNFESYTTDTDYTNLPGISTWGSPGQLASPPTNSDAWDGFESTATTSGDNTLVVNTGYAWATGGQTNAVDYADVYDEFEGYPDGESFVFGQGIGWNGLGQSSTQFVAYGEDDFESYPDGAITSLDGGIGYYWTGDGEFS